MLIFDERELKNLKSYWMTRTDAAASVGVTLRTFDEWGIKPVAKVGRSYRYDVKCILENRLANARGANVMDTESGITKAQADLELTLEKTRKEKFKNDVDEGQYTPNEVIEILCAGLAARIGAELDSVPLVLKRKYDLSVSIVNDLELSIRKCQNACSTLHEQVDEILDEFDLDED